MASAAGAWSTGQQVCALSALAHKLERLERQAELLDGLHAEEQGSPSYLKAYRGSSSSGNPAFKAASPGCGVLSAQVTELKSFIQAVADAELDGDEDLLAVTASHTARYAVRLIRESTDAACVASKAHQVVVDLAAATLSMLSQRAPAHEVMATAGGWGGVCLLVERGSGWRGVLVTAACCAHACCERLTHAPFLCAPPSSRQTGTVPALLQVLDPLQSPCAVENGAKALGNLSADAACRSLIRSSGGVGSLARLLRTDCAPSMQVCVQAGVAEVGA
jgi:hypothetical protein